MIRWLVESSVKARKAVAAVAVGLLILGLFSLRDSKVDTLPEFQPVTVRVQTEALGLSAEEVEQLITVPLEQDLLAGVAWVDTIKSQSVPGLSYIDIAFDEGTDLYRARQVVQERLSQAAALPNVSKPPQMIQPTSSTSRVALISLTSKSLSPVEIGVLTRWTILPRLLAVSGVSNAAVWGQRDRQLQVQIDPKKLQESGTSIEDVISTTGNALWFSPLTFLEASSPGSGGFIESDQQRLGVQHNLPIVKPDDLAQIPIDDANEVGLTLGDVASVVEGHQPLTGDAVVGDGSATGFMIVVERLPDANTVDVTNAIEAAIEELRPGLTGLEIDSHIFRPSDYVERTTDNLITTSWIMLALLLVGLFLLLFQWRAALVCSLTILTTFAVTTFVLRQLNQTLNLVALVGLLLATGAVVDDAVRGVDAVSRRLRMVGDESHKTRIITESMTHTSTGIAWTGLIALVVLLPMAMISGLSGDSFFPTTAKVAAVTMILSALVATVAAPAFSAVILTPGDGATQTSPITDAVARGLGSVGSKLARLPIVGAVAAVAAVVTGVLVIPNSDKALLPKLTDPNLLVEFRGAFGTSLPEMDRVAARAVNELRATPGVRNVAAHVGQASSGDLPVGSETAQMWITLDPDADYNNAVSQVRSIADGYPGISASVSTYSDLRMRTVLTQAPGEVTVRLYGQDTAILQDKANEVRTMLAGLSGVSSPQIQLRPTEPTIEVLVDLAKAQAVGVKPGDVRRVAAVMLAGIQVGSLFENQKVFEVTVWSTPESRSSVSSVEQLPVPLPDGGYIALGEIADVRVRPIQPAIAHENVSRYLDVTAQANDADVDDIQDQVRTGLSTISFPLEYHAEILKVYGDQQDSQQRIWLVGLAALIGLFLLVQACFNSWRIAGLITLSLPIAVLGSLIAAKIDGGPLTLATAAGAAGVIAVAARQSLGLCTRFSDIRRAERSIPIGELTQRGLRDVQPAAITSTLVTIVMLLPLAFQGASVGREVLSKVAVVMIGGCITTLLWTLWVLPALYGRFGPRAETPALSFEADLDETEREFAAVGGD